ncbi:hypothetical protein KTE45_03720 [Burkholderia multivorans]|uniref:hypothetical protein n=1 Tax=Burkholderia multivorans TaxID=87883 RepID=UPI001C2714D9|nr:hypothetical protein [Burkholderia multivorans]MBU9517569.1 hypothetical protein [Burkholderia multivorans]
MTFSLNPSELFDGFDSFDGFDGFDEPMHDHAGAPDEAHVTSYQAVLQEPMVSLVGSVDRPDVASVAILGYN